MDCWSYKVVWLVTLGSKLGLSGSEAHLSLGLVSTNFVVNLANSLLCSLPTFSFSLS